MPLRRSMHPVWAPAPVRMVHLGLGAFFRAHQAWYTMHAGDGPDWGIAAFSGRSRGLADRLAAQDGLYTLTSRGASVDACEVVPSVVATYPGGDLGTWRGLLATPEVSVVTVTVTEAAYAPGEGSVAERLIDGLDVRRRADAGPITVVPCDNLAHNGQVLQGVLHDAAARRDEALAEWLAESVAVVDTVVDRITPRTVDADRVAAARHGWIDAAPVVTEPFSEWVIAGAFAADRPDWSAAGVRFVGDVAPFTRRKLWLLNGAHCLLAHAGLQRGHASVAEAVTDDCLTAWVEAWWEEAAVEVGLDESEITDYTAALRSRFANPRLVHRLDQIAIDGSQKLPVRVLPVARAARAAGRDAAASARQLGAWVAHVRAAADELVDVRAAELRASASGSCLEASARLVTLVDPELAADVPFLKRVAETAGRLATASG